MKQEYLCNIPFVTRQRKYICLNQRGLRKAGRLVEALSKKDIENRIRVGKKNQ